MSHSPRYAPRRISDTSGGKRAGGVVGALLRTSRGRVRRRVGLLALLLTAVLALTGCVDVQLKATVHADGTVSGTARIGIAKSLATLGGGSANSALDELKSQNPCDFGGKAGATKNFDDGTYIGIDCSFSGVTLAEFNSEEDGPKLAKVGDTFQLSGSLNLLKSLTDGAGGLLPSSGATGSSAAPTDLPTDLSSLLPSGFPTDLSSLLPSGFPTDLSSLLPSGIPSDLLSLLPSGLPTDLSSLLPSGLPTDLTSLLPSGAAASGLPGLDPSTLLKSAKINFEFTFPGKVKSSKGKVSGKTVSFTPDSTGNIDFQTVASAKPTSGVAGLGSTAWIGLAVLILLVAALLGLLVRRRRRGQASTGQAAMAGGYPGPQQPGGYPPGYGQQYPQGQYPQGRYPPVQYPDQGQYPQAQYPQAQYPDQGQYPAQTQPYPPAQAPYQNQQYPPPQDYQPPQQYQAPEQNQPYQPDWQQPSAATPPVAPNPWGPPPVEQPPRQNPDGEPGGESGEGRPHQQ